MDFNLKLLLMVVGVLVATLGVAESRIRTVRRELSLKSDEKTVMRQVANFVDEVDPVDPKKSPSSPEEDKCEEDEEHPPLGQHFLVTDSLLHLCMMSNVYTFQKQPDNAIERLIRILQNRETEADDPDWMNKPEQLMEDAENEFFNICVTLLEIRRLNNKIEKAEEANIAAEEAAEEAAAAAAQAP